MKINHLFFGILINLIVISSGCIQEKRNNQVKKYTKFLMKNAFVCDTCVSKLVVECDDYTGSLDFAVISGTVFIPSQLFKSMTDIINSDSTLSKPINTIDFYFSDPNDFEKLWPKEARYISGKQYSGGWKPYKIYGRVCGFNYKKRKYNNQCQLELVFCMKDLKQLPERKRIQ